MVKILNFYCVEPSYRFILPLKYRFKYSKFYIRAVSAEAAFIIAESYIENNDLLRNYYIDNSCEVYSIPKEMYFDAKIRNKDNNTVFL